MAFSKHKYNHNIYVWGSAVFILSNKFILRRKYYKLCIFALVIIMFLYVGGIIYFKNHFYFRTYVNNTNISLCNLKDADEKIESRIKNYEIILKDRNNINSVIKAANINFKYSDKNIIKNILSKQNVFLWFSESFRKNEINEKNMLK